MIAIRGATSIEKNESKHIKEKTIELYDKIMKENDIKKILSIIVSVTSDITEINPVTIIRENFKLKKVALLCVQEAQFKNSKNGIIRFLIHCESNTNNFVFLHDARELRPDLEE
ncbi:chorismate mutase AroH [Tepiditoga spiralis]|uniref:chorismate mutase n=1 Tax=Tepiditoga spiralis TaxID=2108365 RepID=A0A7G1G5T7_9BACT|nr:chorismate mutase [Tepiditoga spiralis]BBE31495.1 chorismate mutase AroH [Tepiditoga spiralis]